MTSGRFVLRHGGRGGTGRGYHIFLFFCYVFVPLLIAFS